jgi:hypothetical protein
MSAFRFLAIAGAVAACVVSSACGRSGHGNGYDGDPAGVLPGDAGPALTSDAAGNALLSPDAACGTATAATHKDPVYLLFVVDGSASMAAFQKWTAEIGALDAIFDDMLGQTDKGLGVGLIAFSDDDDPTYGNGPYPSSLDVPIAYVDAPQHDRLRARVDKSSSGGNTPTYAALSGGYGVLEKLAPPAPLAPNGRKVLVLLTDGVPTGGADEQAQCIAAAADEHKLADPIDTFAIGVGAFPTNDPGDYDPSFVGKLAQAGGTAPPGCDPASTNLASICHLQVTPNGKPVSQIKQEFIDAINHIRGQITSCELRLETTGTLDPTLVNVVYNDSSGQEIVPQDAAQGWTYDDPSDPRKVVLHGDVCTRLKNDPKAKITILVGCRTETR